MYAIRAIALTLTALLSVGAKAQDLLLVTVYDDDVCSSNPLTLTTTAATDFCFGNIGDRGSFGNVQLGINCDAGTAVITTYTDSACNDSPSAYGADFMDCNPIGFSSIRLACSQINDVAGGPTAGVARGNSTVTP